LNGKHNTQEKKHLLLFSCTRTKDLKKEKDILQQQTYMQYAKEQHFFALK
jgi:hypothetical protein